MQVKELLELLSNADPELEVRTAPFTSFPIFRFDNRLAKPNGFMHVPLVKNAFSIEMVVQAGIARDGKFEDVILLGYDTDEWKEEFAERDL